MRASVRGEWLKLSLGLAFSTWVITSAQAQTSPGTGYPPLTRGYQAPVYPSVGFRQVQATSADMVPQPPDPRLPGAMGSAPAPSAPPAAAAPAPASPPGAGPEGTNLIQGERLDQEAAAAEEEAADPTPLMKFLGMEDSPIKIYGWIQNSFTANANGKPANGFNFGVNPNNLANKWMGNQYYLVVEKLLEQNDTVNFGFRIDNLFGNDWQFNHMAGLLDNAYKLNQFSGWDPAQFYGEVHLPILAEKGLDIRVGRFYTLSGYEVVPAIGRPLLSVPYMFNYGQPFTHMGVETTLNLSDNFKLFNCATNGWDRFINEHYKWGYMGGFNWTFNEDKTNLVFICIWGPSQYPTFLPNNTQIFPTGYVNPPGAAGLPNNGADVNTRVLFTSVLTQKWNDKLTQVIETDQASEQAVPGLGGGNRSQSAEWYSFGNWFLYNFNDKLTGVWRSEVFRDDDGVRTGYADTFYEMTLGLVYKPCPWLWLRPEARYDWAQFKTPYDDGTRGSQFTFGMDAILLY